MENDRRYAKTAKQWSLTITKADGTVEDKRYPDDFVMTKIINEAERDFKQGRIKHFELVMVDADVIPK
jgi:hypothetical protein